MNIQQHLNLLGLKVEDRVTGFKGVVATVAFDLYGCIQAVVNPGLDKEGKIGESAWFDVNRLKVTDDFPVMDRPDFVLPSPNQKGPAERPRQNKP